MLEIIVYGIPAPQGSKRFVGHAKNGRGIMVESSAAVKPWREATKTAAVEADIKLLESGKTLTGGPVEVEMIFTLPKPKSAPKTRRTWPDRKPDLSKIIRSTEDAITDAGVWDDDARVISLRARKCYPNEGTDALDRPGAVIRIRAASE